MQEQEQKQTSKTLQIQMSPSPCPEPIRIWLVGMSQFALMFHVDSCQSNHKDSAIICERLIQLLLNRHSDTFSASIYSTEVFSVNTTQR